MLNSTNTASNDSIISSECIQLVIPRHATATGQQRSDSTPRGTATLTADTKRLFTTILVLVIFAVVSIAYKERYLARAEQLLVIRSKSYSISTHKSRSAESLLTCDEECQRFRSLIANESAWPEGKPRAAIVMLLGRKTAANHQIGVFLFTGGFESFAYHFDRNFNDYYHYPMVIFYEELYIDAEERNRLRNKTRSDVFYQPVFFSLPTFVNLSTPFESCLERQSQGVGYKHMCRFHAKFIYDTPILQTKGLEYVWRLDDDSFLTRNVSYDPFLVMKKNRYRYGYVAIFQEGRCWSPGLWNASDKFWNGLGIPQKFPMPEPDYFYNNFEISALSVWRTPEYLQYFEYIDRLGGIYHYRWGDGTIKSIAVSRLLYGSEIHKFDDIAYRHNGWVIRG